MHSANFVWDVWPCYKRKLGIFGVFYLALLWIEPLHRNRKTGLSLSLSLCVCVCVYIYIKDKRKREKKPEPQGMAIEITSMSKLSTLLRILSELPYAYLLLLEKYFAFLPYHLFYQLVCFCVRILMLFIPMCCKIYTVRGRWFGSIMGAKAGEALLC